MEEEKEIIEEEKEIIDTNIVSIGTIGITLDENQTFEEQIQNRVVKDLKKKQKKSISTEEFKKLIDNEIMKTKEKQNNGQLHKAKEIQTKYFDEKQTDVAVAKIFIICVFKREPGCPQDDGFDELYALSSNCSVKEIGELKFNNKYKCEEVGVLEENEVLFYKEIVNKEASCCSGYTNYIDFRIKKIEEIDKNVDFSNFEFKYFNDFVVYSFKELKNKLFKEKDKYY